MRSMRLKRQNREKDCEHLTLEKGDNLVRKKIGIAGPGNKIK